MSARKAWISALMILPLLLTSDGGGHSAVRGSGKAGLKRIKFQIATVEEIGGQRHVLSTSTIEGPPGTDFHINLESRRFKMDARFLTDLLADNSLKVRAKLETRRLYGYSAKNLPLYEEDVQGQTLSLGFEEEILLLPFGRQGDDRLSIEITPVLTGQPAYLATGEMTPPQINIDDQNLSGVINIEASKVPHAFAVEAALLEDGREVARSQSTLTLEEAREMIFEPLDPANAELAAKPLALNLTVAQFTQNCSADRMTINFDLYHLEKPGENGRAMIAANWQGVANAGADLRYDLSKYYSGLSGRKYELRLNIKPADL
ncbi:MAG: hypothetical protein V7641_1374 [Blastocatellia bacterium]